MHFICLANIMQHVSDAQRVSKNAPYVDIKLRTLYAFIKIDG
jgi:hypothetical protein